MTDSRDLEEEYERLSDQVGELGGQLLQQILCYCEATMDELRQVIDDLQKRQGPREVHVVRVYKDRAGMYRQAAFSDQTKAARWGARTAGVKGGWSGDTLEIDREVGRG